MGMDTFHAVRVFCDLLYRLRGIGEELGVGEGS